MPRCGKRNSRGRWLPESTTSEEAVLQRRRAVNLGDESGSQATAAWQISALEVGSQGMVAGGPGDECDFADNGAWRGSAMDLVTEGAGWTAQVFRLRAQQLVLGGGLAALRAQLQPIFMLIFDQSHGSRTHGTAQLTVAPCDFDCLILKLTALR